MRNFLMAATAIAGVAASTAAFAQMPNAPLVTSGISQTATGTNPEPGTVLVRMRARVVVDDGIGSDTNTVQKGTNGKPNGTKQGNLYFSQYARLYPSLDATAANGLQYGAAMEIRQNSGTNRGLGTNGSANTLFFRREAGYVGTPTAGRVYFGQTDAALGRFMTGTMEAYDYNGGWNGDAPAFVSGATQLSWAFPEDSGIYDGSRLVYLSPAFGAFDFGASFEPNYSTGASGAGISSYSTTPAQTTVRRNMFDVAGRYKGSFGSTAVVLEGGYMGSGVVNNSLAASTTAKAKGLSVIDAGVKVDFSGITIGAHYTGGAMNNNYAPLLSGQKNGTNFAGGVAYTMGTVIVGVQYINELNAGKAATNAGGAVTNTGSMLHEIGFGVGGTWDYAPGALAYVSALYGTRHQSGIDLLNGNATNSKFNNSTIARVLQVGNVVNF